MRRSLSALILPLSVFAACEASRPVEPPRRPVARPAPRASAPIASASASSSGPIALVPADNDPLAPLPAGAIARCGTTRMRILDTAESVAVTDDGKALSIESESSEKVIKDLLRGAVLHKLPPCIDPTLSHDGSFVVAALQKPAGEIAFFRTADGQRMRAAVVPLPPVTTTFHKHTSTSPARVQSILISGDDRRVVVTTSAGTAHIIDATEGKLIASFPVDADILGIDKAGSRAIATKSGHSILSLEPKGWLVIDLANGKVLRRYEPKPNAATRASEPEPSYGASVALSADGKTVFAKDWNALWSVDVATGTATKEWEKPSAGSGLFGALGSFGFTRGGLRATPRGGVAFVEDSDAVEWHPGSSSPSHLGHGQPVAFSPSGQVALVQDGRLVEIAGHDSPELPEGHSGTISSLAFLGGGSVLASGGNDLRMWRIPSGTPLARTSSHGEIRNLVGSADGTSLLLQGRKLRVVSASGRVETLELKESVSLFDLDATGRRVVVVLDHWDTGPELALVTRGTVGPRLKPDGKIKAVAFSPSGESIASLEQADDEERKSRVVLRDSNTLEQKSVLEWPFLSGAEHIAFAGSDHNLIVSDSYRGATSFDLEARVPLRHFSYASCCDALAVSRDGKLVAGASRDRIAVWESETRKLLGVFSGHARPIDAVAFSPDGRIIASGSEDTTALLWDVSRATAALPGYETHLLNGPTTARSLSRGAPSWYVSEGKPVMLEKSRGNPARLDDVNQIIAGSLSSCALRNSGKLSCWGWTWGGALGIPEERVNKSSVKDREAPVELAGVPEVGSFDFAEHHGCALTRSGNVWCWGTPSGAKLSPAQIAPHQVPGVSSALAIAVGGGFACIARHDGKVACWGNPAAEPFPISAAPAVIDGVQDATSVAAGTQHVCALRRDGKVSCWGSNSYDQLGNNTGLDSAVPVEVAGVSQAVQLEATSSLTCARTQSQAVWCWGGRSYGSAPGFFEPAEVTHLAGATDLRVTGNLVCGDTPAGLRCIRLL